MREFTPTAIKNLFAALNFIEQDELSAALGRQVDIGEWRIWPDNFRKLFVRASDNQRENLAYLINSKLAKEPEHV